MVAAVIALLVVLISYRFARAFFTDPFTAVLLCDILAGMDQVKRRPLIGILLGEWPLYAPSMLVFDAWQPHRVQENNGGARRPLRACHVAAHPRGPPCCEEHLECPIVEPIDQGGVFFHRVAPVVDSPNIEGGFIFQVFLQQHQGLVEFTHDHHEFAVQGAGLEKPGQRFKL